MSRIETREHALELLFQCFFRNDPVAGQIDLFKENNPDLAGDETYFLEIVYGVINKRDEIDALYAPFLKNWKLDRLPLTGSYLRSLSMRSRISMRSLPLFPSTRL